ncbi:MAG: hypothetical protein WDN46_14725 [Methylocella sp.]
MTEPRRCQRIVSRKTYLAVRGLDDECRPLPDDDDVVADEAESGALAWKPGEPTAKIKRPIFDTDLSFKGVAATNQPPPNPYEPRPPRDRMFRRRLTGRRIEP